MYIKYYNTLKCYVYLSNLFRFIIKKDKKIKKFQIKKTYITFSKLKKNETMIKKKITYLIINLQFIVYK